MNTYELIKSNGKKIIVGAETKEEAEQILANSELVQANKDIPAEKLALKKEQLINEAKSSAIQFLDKTDYLVQRHFEEVTLKVETTLTEKEYKALLTKRNKARIDSNTEEATIKSKVTLKELEAVKISEKK